MKKIIWNVVLICMILSLICGISACRKNTTQNEIVDDVAAVTDTSVVEDNEQSDEEIERPVDEEPIIEDTTEVNNETTEVEVETSNTVIPEDVIESDDSVEAEVPTTPIESVNRDDAIMLAKLVYGEARGVYSLTEQACVMWTVLNRVDAGYGDTIAEVITAPGQYYYSSSFGTIDGYGRDLVALAEDVLTRWYREKAGETDVGRVLPADYLWFHGDGEHNWFRNAYQSPYDKWYYSWPSPYES